MNIFSPTAFISRGRSRPSSYRTESKTFDWRWPWGSGVGLAQVSPLGCSVDGDRLGLRGGEGQEVGIGCALIEN